VVPKIDDEFAKDLGKFESVEQLKGEMKKNLKHEKEHREKERYQGEMTEKLAEKAEFGQIPDALIAKETDRLINEFNQMLAMQQKTVDDYLKEKGRTIEQVREEMKPSAEKSVKVGLALRKFAEQEDIKVDEKELDEKVQEYIQRFGSAKEAEKQADPEEVKEQLAYMLRNQKAMETLESKITIREEKTDKAKNEK